MQRLRKRQSSCPNQSFHSLLVWLCSESGTRRNLEFASECDVSFIERGRGASVVGPRRRKRPSLAECLVFRNNSDSSTRLHRHPIAQCHPKKASSRKQHRNTNKKSNPKENTKKHQRPSNMQPLLHPSATVVGDFLVAIGSSEASFTERVGERQFGCRNGHARCCISRRPPPKKEEAVSASTGDLPPDK